MLELAPKEYERTLSWDYAFLYSMFFDIDYKKGWRLPTITELQQFDELDIATYWTSKTFDGDAELSRGYDFLHQCVISDRSHGNRAKVRPVRGVMKQTVEIAPKAFESYLNWHDATLYCFSLNINGKVGWRLPSVLELKEMYLVDTDFEGGYWSSTESELHATCVFMSHFYTTHWLKNDSMHIRPVRTI